jgi:hypothetical protein
MDHREKLIAQRSLKAAEKKSRLGATLSPRERAGLKDQEAFPSYANRHPRGEVI